MKKLIAFIFITLLVTACSTTREETTQFNISTSTSTNTEVQIGNDSTVTISPEMEQYKEVVDEAMVENFDYYESYYDSEGALNLDITAEGLVDAMMLARDGDQECIDSWNEMIEALVSSNNSLVESAQLLKVEDPVVIFNLLNDANHDNVLLCIKNGEILYDALVDGDE